MDNIIDIANTYMAEHNGELPLLVVAHSDKESRIILCKLREKHALADQNQFIKIVRLASLIYGYNRIEFVLKPEFNYTELNMTKNTWAVGEISADIQRAEFFELEDEKLVPYFEEMPIGGQIVGILPHENERGREFKPEVVKQIKLYIENSTYNLPVKQQDVVEALDGLDALFAHYEAA
jgi:hypothetical protein